MEVPVFRGTITAAKGHLGAFEISVDDYAPASVSARSWLEFEAPRDGAVSKCDVILDLTGGAPLFPAGERVDGYFRPDPGNPALVQKAPEGAVRCLRHGRRIREAALCEVHRRSLRPFAQHEDRLHEVPRRLPGLGHRAGR
jgi:hypothetical protein